MQFPGVVSVEGMMSTGLLSRAGWMFEALASDSERQAFLSVVYPNASISVISQALQRAQDAWSTGQVLNQRMTMPPLDTIPENPNVSGDNTIGIDTVVVIPDPNAPNGQRRIPVRIDTPYDVSGDELLDTVYAELQQKFKTGSIDHTGMAFPGQTVDLSSVNASILILSVTRR